MNDELRRNWQEMDLNDGTYFGKEMVCFQKLILFPLKEQFFPKCAFILSMTRNDVNLPRNIF